MSKGFKGWPVDKGKRTYTRSGSTGSMRVTKRTWYANGGFASNLCWRRQVGGAWHYFIKLQHY